MSVTHSSEHLPRVDNLNEKIKQQVKGNWLHNFHVSANREIISAESYAYRRKVLDQLFASLFRDRSVLVMDEASGFYPALSHRAGCKSVTACNAQASACGLMNELFEFLDIPATVLESKLMAFYDSEPYVDMRYGQSHEFLLSIGQLWPLFGASAGNFDAVVEACSFFVTEGLVFDWNDAKWASPPPPHSYNLPAFCEALRKKFEYVMCYSDWLVVAAGKLPVATDKTTDTPQPEYHVQFREAVGRVVPPGSTVIIASKGDAELVALEGRTAWHFPQREDGVYAGYYPPDSAAAISHLEALRMKGGEYLAFPHSALWWLEHYEEFRQHLETRYRRLEAAPEAGAIFALKEPTKFPAPNHHPDK